MNTLQKMKLEKRTENGDVSYKSTGDNLTDLMFMTAFFEKHLNQVTIGDTDRDKLFSMFVREPRFGLGRRDLGRKLMELSNTSAEDIVTAGRYDDLFNIPTDENLDFLYKKLVSGDELAKKWMPRLTGKDKKIAKALCKMWGIDEKTYRKLIKTDKTVEYKLSYAEKNENGTPLDALFNKNTYRHPLVNEINFEEVPSLAMTKYINAFSTRDDIKDRFNEYMKGVQEGKKKVNVSTANVVDAYKVSTGDWCPQDVEVNKDILAKKVVENETDGLVMDAICVLDTSGSMYWTSNGINIGEKATAVAHAIATHSTYAPNQVISFSSRPQLMTIKGDTLKEQYKSMYTGDCSNTNLGRVLDLLKGLNKFPKFIIVMTDMEFDYGSSTSKKELYEMFKENNIDTKLIWWNFNDRNKTVPEIDEYGNYYLSGYNLQILKLLENNMDMTTYIDKILDKYKKDIAKN